MGRHGDGFSIKKDFYQFWLRSQKKRKEGRQGRAKGRVVKVLGGCIKGRRNRMNSSPPLFAACLQCLLLFGGSMNLFLFIFFLDDLD